MLARLRRDARGSAAVMLAAMVIPLLLFVGSAVDVSRVYTVKARLQQACDAGVLAGRRSMIDTSTTTPLDATATAQAKAFFNNNFHNNQDATDPTNPANQGTAGWMQTTSAPDPVKAGKYLAVFQPSKTPEAQVQGTATVKVPMAVMKMFGFQPITLTATCEARFDTADADIMFVLDVTGSMGCLTSDAVSDCNNYAATTQQTNADGSVSVVEKSGSRIDGLRTAVLNFFDLVTKLKASGGSADPATNFRFGFVPYNATANVGRILQPMGYMKTSASYQSREVSTTTPEYNSGSPTVTVVSKTQAQCTGTTRTPTGAGTWNGSGFAHYYTLTWNSGQCKQADQLVYPNWVYKQKVQDTSQFILPGTTITLPTEVDGTTSKWAGCVEERLDPTSDNQTTFSYTSPPKDLDPDGAPAVASDGWAPWWGDVEYDRTSSPSETSGDINRTQYSRYYGSWYYTAAQSYNELACPLTAMRLTQTTVPGYSSASTKANVRAAIQTYLSASNGFRPYGSTYHDVGMLWGLRLISPTGMFANDTAAWVGHNAPNRYIIFLTDGDMESDPVGDGAVYSANGMEKFDSRVANGATGNALNSYHNARFAAVCQMAKNRNIKIFTIAYAQTITTQLAACATPGQAYYASDTTSLNAAFSSIAQQLALLRISK